MYTSSLGTAGGRPVTLQDASRQAAEGPGYCTLSRGVDITAAVPGTGLPRDSVEATGVVLAVDGTILRDVESAMVAVCGG